MSDTALTPQWVYIAIITIGLFTLIVIFGALSPFGRALLVFGLVMAAGGLAAMAHKATTVEDLYPPCVAEDGGPIPCRFDGGVDENGFRRTIIFRQG